MSANRVQYFIRSILQNSKLNRVNFVNNKKKYNMMTVKNTNHNMIVKRNFSSSNSRLPNLGGGPNNSTIILLAIALISHYNNRKQ